jgi:hypothetical protein
MREPISGVPVGSVSGMSSDGFVSAGSTASVTHEFDRDGRIVRLYARAYYGHERNVTYDIFTTQGSSGHKKRLVQSVTGDDSTDGLAGNGETFDLDLDHEFTTDDSLTFEFTNDDGTNAQPVQAFVIVEYGGH